MAGACVIYDNKVLVLQQKEDGPQPLKWGPPGGHGEKSEKPIDTATREVKEETNLSIKIQGLVSASIAETPSGKIFAVIIYSAKPLNVDGIQISNESNEYRWVDIGELEDLDLREESLREILMRSLSQSPAPLDTFNIVKFREEH